MSDDRWVLASASPRRRELLEAAGQVFEVCPSSVEEPRPLREDPERFVSRMAGEKAAEVSRRRPDRWVLAADTVVVLDGEILGKPADRADARRMLGKLSGRTHSVVTAFVLLRPRGRRFREGVVVSEVSFRPLAGAEIAAYAAGGEPLDKAGAYAIQGGAGRFVSALRGSWSNVVGLPIEEVGDCLAAAGLWRTPETA